MLTSPERLRTPPGPNFRGCRGKRGVHESSMTGIHHGCLTPEQIVSAEFPVKSGPFQVVLGPNRLFRAISR